MQIQNTTHSKILMTIKDNFSTLQYSLNRDETFDANFRPNEIIIHQIDNYDDRLKIANEKVDQLNKYISEFQRPESEKDLKNKIKSLDYQKEQLIKQRDNLLFLERQLNAVKALLGYDE